MRVDASTIVRCIKRDLGGDLEAGARYARKIAAEAARNPWADSCDAIEYAEAARRLESELEAKNLKEYAESFEHEPWDIEIKEFRKP